MQGMRRKLRERERSAIEELRQENPVLCQVARIEFLEGIIIELERDLVEAYRAYERYKQRDLPYWWRKAVMRLRDEVGIRKKVKRFKGELYYRQSGKEDKSRVTRHMIDRAIERDITDFIEVNKAGFAKCLNPSHEDGHPSMLVKNNFAYCFSCGWSGDCISVYRQVNNVGFVMAVKNLSQ